MHSNVTTTICEPKPLRRHFLRYTAQILLASIIIGNLIQHVGKYGAQCSLMLVICAVFVSFMLLARAWRHSRKHK